MILSYWARLYQNMTAPEVALEPAIAALGERYRPQHPFFGLRLIADFALLDRKLIIEVDGDSHDNFLQKYKDLQHMIALKALGWNVVRVRNEAAKADPDGTVQAALSAVPQTAPELQASLERHLRDYPEIPALLAKKSKSRKPRRKATSAAGKRGAGLGKPTAS